MDDIDRKKLLSLKGHDGWQVFINKALPERIHSLERRTARYRYEHLYDLLVDQAKVQVYESLEGLLDEFINAHDER